MTITTVAEHNLPIFGNGLQNSSMVTQGNSAVTSANASAAAIVQAPKTGTIDKIYVLVGSVSGTTPTIDCRLETLTGQFPSGTLLGAGSNATQAVATNTGYIVTLGTAVAVTRGQLFAIVFTYSLGTTINIKLNNGLFNLKFSYGAFKTAGAYAAASTPVCTVGYNDSSYPFNYPLVPALATATNFNSSSTPDERGNKFNLLVGRRIAGIQVAYQNSSAAADFDLCLYSTDGTTLLASVSIDADQLFGTSGGWMRVFFSANVDLAIGNGYRVTVKPTTTTDNAWVRYQGASSAIMEALPGGTDWGGTSRTDAGAWTDVATDWYAIGLICTGIDIPASGSGIAQLAGGGLVTA